eukprot:14325014-Ditylum_brightwellii.AAC.1
MRRPEARVLMMDDEIRQKHYNTTLKKLYARHNIEERMNKLMSNIQFPCTPAQTEEWEEIDALRMKGR